MTTLHWDSKSILQHCSFLEFIFHKPIFSAFPRQVFPDVPGEVAAGLSSGAFLSCSADGTIRLWRIDDWSQTRAHSQNILSRVSLALISVCPHVIQNKWRVYIFPVMMMMMIMMMMIFILGIEYCRSLSGQNSRGWGLPHAGAHPDPCRTPWWVISLSITALQDLLNIIYVDGNTAALLDADCVTSADKSGDGQATESRTGIRTICVSPDGKHLASGDRNGMLR